MFRGLLKSVVPSWKNVLLAVFAAVLLILAFPDFEFWFFAWFALVPLMWAIEREKASSLRSFLLGWLFGTLFFFGTCWWLAYAPIHYAAFQPLLAYSLILIVCLGAGVFPGIFASILSIFLRRFGSWAFLAAPFVWVACEFARYWITGNDWNAIGYSMAMLPGGRLNLASYGGVLLCSFYLLFWNAHILYLSLNVRGPFKLLLPYFGYSVFLFVFFVAGSHDPPENDYSNPKATLIAIQPNVPMSGLDSQKWHQYRDRQISLSENEIWEFRHPSVVLFSGEVTPLDPPEPPERPILVVLPESPMNFMYNDDREFQKFINDFARENNVSVLFNSSEPDKGTTKYFNSAVMVGPDGSKVAEYDKIYLLPFGEAVPSFLEGTVPGFVGNFAYGREYNLFPIGDAKAGVMICFESHFGQLSREYVKNGADVIIEMTNDGYLGPTPVLRQHLANAVFRAVETNRPVLRVTNVGITSYIYSNGYMCDSSLLCNTEPYSEDTRVWSVVKSDGSQTFYVKYGDWFAWLCTIITLGLLGSATFRRGQQTI